MMPVPVWFWLVLAGVALCSMALVAWSCARMSTLCTREEERLRAGR